ncbi:hypothetical protein GCM10007973_28860 [Polymorphobacter multimanifer]|uniref:Uncharacterized protein n=1 Tax=Polymorphobacter multimanifer TaxID=1070431 RepID=A0A841L8G0_9SPHN|nr:hypothetical protein [Polymorphobacter multimanifer]MBB6229319.1 hypothetical protein [Polymorphobacter multimanifer]GGI90780.1 hypothetical protein GCM10007973_28860 [Polymorphobacter multimanifer]
MFDVWSSTSELGQPCLRRGLNSRLIDLNGLVRKQALSGLDRVLCEHLATGRASFQVPMQSPPLDPARRFLNVSALQKAIRQGDAVGAMRFAQQGCSVNAEQIFRRLAVCAVEDVGIGNLLAVGMALAVMGNRSMRENSADELAAYLAYLLAISPKSRIACDLLSICDFDRALDPLKTDLVRASPDSLRSRASDPRSPYAERMAAIWLIAGTSRFTGMNMPTINRTRADVMFMMTASRMPLMLYYIADRTAARTADAMFISYFLIAEMIAAEPDIRLSDRTIGAKAKIAGFPAAAFDLHTHEGRWAIGQFGRQCPPVAEMLLSVKPTMRDMALCYGVFIAEGGELANQVSFVAAENIEYDAHHAELAFTGIADASAQAQFLTAITNYLPMLNQYRFAALRRN